MTRDSRALVASLRSAIHGGRAQSSTADLLDAVAREPEVPWPMTGGLQPTHLRERAAELRLADKFLDSLGSVLDEAARDLKRHWEPVEDLLPNVRVLLGRWRTYQNTDGPAYSHWQQAVGWYHVLPDTLERAWCLDGFTFQSQPFYGVEPTHFCRIPSPPELQSLTGVLR